ncbi:MAG TPA: flagellar hook-associated protein FlgK [Pirellulaceae bacterium]|nr:flagellar hook-associated protein FlgK [Pirellulaceae bacterium]HMO90914.1 flagellar hook-associated protein FlgK [Pirellulaceae bacterium]HMP68610.1 flagellar hook-associated protein FlgK [Pirellulaceae bacterium]
MNIAITLSSLRAAQIGLDTSAHNIANANTAGYHRQRMLLSTRTPQWIENLHLGSGVNINRLERMRSQVVEAAYTNSLSELRGIGQHLTIARQIETEFLPGNGSIHQSLTNLFSEMSRLSANPNEFAARNSVVQQAVQLSSQTQRIANRLSALKNDVSSQINIEVQILNQELAQLANLQGQIQTSAFSGSVPNDLLDQRDQLINRIAEKIDIQRFEHAYNGFGLSIGGSSVSLGSVPVVFEVDYDSNGRALVKLAGTSREVTFMGGTLPSLIEAHNVTIPAYQSRLDDFAQTLMREFDQAHAKGVGTYGPFSVLRGARGFKDSAVPISQAQLAFPVSAGELFISVTDPSGGKRTYSISIDPAVDSLNDIANRISQLPTLHASVDNQNRQFSIFAQPGYRFDFTGNLETIPDLSTYSGTAMPGLSGEYTGSVNRQVTIVIDGTGTVGKTPGLTARVLDASTGLEITAVNIGDGYEVDSLLDVGDGVKLKFSAGDVVDGDRFSTTLVAESDSTGILSALGLNSFFEGANAGDIRVASRIVNDTRQLATSRSGEIGDTTNLINMIRLQGKQLLGVNNISFQDYLDEVTSSIGFEVMVLQHIERNAFTVNQQSEQEIAALSGVDLNEELLLITQYQQQYQAAVQVLQTMNLMMDELLNLVR